MWACSCKTFVNLQNKYIWEAYMSRKDLYLLKRKKREHVKYICEQIISVDKTLNCV